ncbi:hypothetical protein [Flagellimonas sp. S3867]|uniref:hypothetical protein n=1 Tax=Flagellimonas sp. S3867 TaxID=2768063 RepID=UPI0016897B87|nr:hypothetical protein [Flagellimonas sp. S3867]
MRNLIFGINQSLTLLFLLMVLGGCNTKKSERNLTVKKLIGNWEWSYTKGNEKGDHYNVTPESMNMAIKYHFDKDSVSIFINNTLNEKYSFYFSGDTLFYGKEKVLFEMPSNDSLMLRNSSCCDDIFEKLFVKGKH